MFLPWASLLEGLLCLSTNPWLSLPIHGQAEDSTASHFLFRPFQKIAQVNEGRKNPAEDLSILARLSMAGYTMETKLIDVRKVIKFLTSIHLMLMPIKPSSHTLNSR